jgi:hypothetical protein
MKLQGDVAVKRFYFLLLILALINLCKWIIVGNSFERILFGVLYTVSSVFFIFVILFRDA